MTLADLYEGLFLDSRLGKFTAARDKIDKAKELLDWDSHEQGFADNALHLKLHSVIAFIDDSLGDYDAAERWVTFHGPQVMTRLMESLESITTADGRVRDERRDLLFARTWFVLRYAVSRYRRSKFTESRDALALCAECSGLLVDMDYGQENAVRTAVDGVLMLASVCYWKSCGLVYTTSLEEAEKGFMEALRLISERAHDRTSRDWSDAEAVHADYISGKILLGLGLVKFRQGALASAKSHLLAARSLLRRAPDDEIRLNRAKLLLLSVERILVHSQGDPLFAVIKELEKLKFPSHKTYQCRTLLTLANAYVSLSDAKWDLPELGKEACLAKAKALTEEAKELCDETKLTDYLECRMLVSRILRKQGNRREAATIARSTLDDFKTKHEWEQHPFHHTQALMTDGHAWYKLGKDSQKREDLDKAADSFSKAIGLSHGSALLQGRCHLYLARVYHELRQPREAWDHYQMWEKIENLVESGAVGELATRVRQELEVGMLVIRGEQVPDKDAYYACELRLRDFLLNHVLKGLSDTAKEKRLGKTRGTITKWEHEVALGQRIGKKNRSRKSGATKSK